MIKSYLFSLLTVVAFIYQIMEPIFNNFIVTKLFYLLANGIERSYYFINGVLLNICCIILFIYLYLCFILKYNKGDFYNEIIGFSDFLYDETITFYCDDYKTRAKLYLFFYLLINSKLNTFRSNFELLEEIKQERICQMRKRYGVFH